MPAIVAVLSVSKFCFEILCFCGFDKAINIIFMPFVSRIVICRFKFNCLLLKKVPMVTLFFDMLSKPWFVITFYTTLSSSFSACFSATCKNLFFQSCHMLFGSSVIILVAKIFLKSVLNSLTLKFLNCRLNIILGGSFGTLTLRHMYRLSYDH